MLVVHHEKDFFHSPQSCLLFEFLNKFFKNGPTFGATIVASKVSHQNNTLRYMLEWFVPSCINHNKYKLIPQEMFVPIYKSSLFNHFLVFNSVNVCFSNCVNCRRQFIFIQAVAPLLILLLAIIREVTKFNNVQG